MAGALHEGREELFAVGVVVVSFGGGRSHGDNEVRAGNSQLEQGLRIGPEFPGVHIFFDAGVFPEMAIFAAKRAIRNHGRGYHPMRTDQRRIGGMLVIINEDGWDAEQVAEEDLRARAVGDTQCRFFAKDEGGQLEGAPGQPGGFREAVLPVVTANLEVLEPFLVGQVADLESVAGGNEQRMAPGAELVNDGLEERNMRSVVEIEPDLGAN